MKYPNLNELSKALEKHKRENGLSQTELASKAKVSQRTISNILNESNTPETATIQKLITNLRLKVGGENVELASQDLFTVPVVDYIQAGSWRETTDPFPAGEGMRRIGVNIEMENAFALEIKGDSMAPDFKQGDIVIIDPYVNPIPGDCVVAKLDIDDTATFKKYRPRGFKNGRECIELAPLNPDYPTLEINEENQGRIIGTMVEHRRYRRR